jgi:DNA polymerase-3 subunit delta
MTHTDIIRDIKAGQLRPVYFLQGEEPYFIDEIVKSIEHDILNEAERSFNQTVLYGRDVDAMTVLDNVRRYPMMSDKQVVILKEAQEMKGFDQLLGYIEKPLKSTVFCIAYRNKKLDMRTKFGKAIQQHAVVFDAKPIYDNQLPDWIKQYLVSKKLSIGGDAAFLLAENLGADLSKVANELDKLALNLAPGTKVTPEHVETFIGISREYNLFELSKAIGMRDILKTQKIVRFFSQNQRAYPVQSAIPLLFNYFSKVYVYHFVKSENDKTILEKLGVREFQLREYKSVAGFYSLLQVERIVDMLREYDGRSKGINNDSADSGDLMTELCWKILHV